MPPRLSDRRRQRNAAAIYHQVPVEILRLCIKRVNDHIGYSAAWIVIGGGYAGALHGGGTTLAYNDALPYYAPLLQATFIRNYFLTGH